MIFKKFLKNAKIIMVGKLMQTSHSVEEPAEYFKQAVKAKTRELVRKKSIMSCRPR